MTPSSRSAGTQPITRESWLHAALSPSTTNMPGGAAGAWLRLAVGAC